MTLRLRLILVLIGVVAVGLIAAAVATYALLSSFLLGRFDSELYQAVPPLTRAIEAQIQGGPFGFGPVPNFGGAQGGVLVEPGTFGEIVDPSGTVLWRGFVVSEGPIPNLPTPLPQSKRPGQSVYFSVSSSGSSPVEYRAVAVSLGDGAGTIVAAIPLTNVHQTLSRLVLTEVLVGIVVLGGLAFVAWWLVRRELRPLDTMAATAGAIAAGDLTMRVTPAGDGTEVGELGSALNKMLEEIEGAFDARAASEERLRRFLADASHELRTPLTSIRGYAEMFDRGAKDRPEDLATSMRHIRNETARMSVMVEDLLLLARLGHERPIAHENVDLTDVVASSVDAALAIDPERSVTLQSVPDAPVVGDADRLRQMVDNLLTNAMTHTPPATPVEVRLLTDGDTAVLEVQDHGTGIAPEDRPRIFEPFFRSDASRARATGGAGLGLSIVSSIVVAHGGEVGVGEGMDGGAIFQVRLPLGELPSPEAVDISNSSSSTAHRPPFEPPIESSHEPSQGNSKSEAFRDSEHVE
ncbi:MAG TPA: HAMP domain-containing sensor histidine kinase, partial [Acidimicrobiales bacterium]|nr:HAMP domain-containing sensor histidine kinase [Acidimicrobiales bacterium]